MNSNRSKKSTLFPSFIALCVILAAAWWMHQHYAPTPKPAIKTSVKSSTTTTPPEPQKAQESKPENKPLPKPNEPSLQLSSFKKLPGWYKANLSDSLKTFRNSCRVFLRLPPNQKAGTDNLTIKAKDWQFACKKALSLPEGSINPRAAKAFFEAYFRPLTYTLKQPVQGLFTGYYMPEYKGSLVRTSVYNVPVYGVPKNLVEVNLRDFDSRLPQKHLFGRVSNGRLRPYFTHREINNGAIKQHGKAIVWLKSMVDRTYLEIQGSGIVLLPNGERMALGYAAQNGAPYTAIGSVLIRKGVMTRDNASMQRIRKYLESHPKAMKTLLERNQSFVFFRVLPSSIALGAQGIGLTPGFSLAVDRSHVPLGTPIWLSTTRPDKHHDDKTPLQRLMIAQDTGGAIKGHVRGDVYWGSGSMAEEVAGRMKNPGHYWLLLPKRWLESTFLPKQKHNAKATQKPRKP